MTGRTGGDVERYQLPDSRKAKLSLSGSETNSFFALNQEQVFQDISALSGLDSTSDSRCIAAIDFDRDGLQDFMVTNTNDSTLNIFQNRRVGSANKNNFVAVQVVGGNVTLDKQTGVSNRDAIGTKIFVTRGETKSVNEVRCGEGLATQNGPIQIIGIGTHNVADSIEVVFPSGKRKRIADAATGKLFRIYEDSAMSDNKDGVEVADYRSPKGSGQKTAISPVEDLPRNLSFDRTEAPLRIILAMATWCEKCKGKIDEVAWLKQHFGDQVDVVAVPVDLKDSQKKLDAYVEKHKPQYSVLKKDLMRSMAMLDLVNGELGNASIPNSIVLSQNNKILKVMHGLPTISELRHLAAQHGIRLN